VQLNDIIRQRQRHMLVTLLIKTFKDHFHLFPKRHRWVWHLFVVELNTGQSRRRRRRGVRAQANASLPASSVQYF